MSLLFLCIASMMLTIFFMWSLADILCFLYARTQANYYGMWGEIGSAALKMTWMIIKMATRLIWYLAWDILEIVDNQYLGCRSKLSALIIQSKLLLTKYYKMRLEIPKNYMVLSEFMLCPVFIGNHGLCWSNEAYVNMFKQEQKETNIEKIANILERMCDYYVD